MSFFGELKRRNVTRVAVFYLVAAWVILQVAELLFDAIGVPGELLRFIIVLLILGFPITLIFSWVYEVTPEGIKREKDIDRSQSITTETGKRINVAIVVLLVIAIAFMKRGLGIQSDSTILKVVKRPFLGRQDDLVFRCNTLLDGCCDNLADRWS